MEPTSAGGQASGCSLAPACPPARTQVLSTCPILQHQCLCRASHPPGKGLHGRLGGQTTLMPPPTALGLPAPIWTVCPSSLSQGDFSSRKPS